MMCNRRAVAVIAVFCLSALVMVTSARADVVLVGDQAYFGNWSGGAVTAYGLSPSTWSPFKTFCAEVEGLLYVNGGPGYSYRLNDLGMSSDRQPTPKTLSEHTAWLYTSFLDGTLSGFLTGSLAQEKAVQYGIWNSLGYTDDELSAQGALDAQARADYLALGWNVTPQQWSGYGEIQIANLVYLPNGSPAQDVLVRNHGIIPEPVTMALLGFGLVGLVVRRRPK